jgi:Mobilization protein NikA
MYERTELLKARVTPDEKDRAKRLAAREGTDVSGLIRRRLFADAEEEVVVIDPMFGDVEEPALAEVSG